MTKLKVTNIFEELIRTQCTFVDPILLHKEAKNYQKFKRGDHENILGAIQTRDNILSFASRFITVGDGTNNCFK
jgi:hypothetical protein